MNVKKTQWLCAICISGTILASCSASENDAESGDNERNDKIILLESTTNDVSVMPLKKRKFSQELLSNGKIAPQRKAELRFETNEIVTKVYVKNGDRVHKGDKLAELDMFKLQNALLNAEDALERAKLDLQDVLIGQGYAVEDFEAVPEDVMKLAKVKSGYDQSMIQYDQAKRNVECATLTAPFDGVVANLFTKPYNPASTSETFCTVMDTEQMEVDFTVLESELPLIKVGDRVVIVPYAETSSHYEGRVSEINPTVDDNGMVKVKASVNAKGRLFSGMNVKVSVRRTLDAQLIIPKTAVVQRSGRTVVFTLQNGKAIWNYVQTGMENADSCVVSDRSADGVEEGLLEGDTVIVSGNVNLAHESPVVVTK